MFGTIKGIFKIIWKQSSHIQFNWIRLRSILKFNLIKFGPESRALTDVSDRLALLVLPSPFNPGWHLLESNEYEIIGNNGDQ